MGHRKVRTGGIDLDKARTRTTMAAVTALAPAPGGFTVANVAAKVNELNPHATYTARQAANDSASSAATPFSPSRPTAAATMSRPKPPRPSPASSRLGGQLVYPSCRSLRSRIQVVRSVRRTRVGYRPPPDGVHVFAHG
jgi:hypothetical protein